MRVKLSSCIPSIAVTAAIISSCSPISDRSYDFGDVDKFLRTYDRATSGQLDGDFDYDYGYLGQTLVGEDLYIVYMKGENWCGSGGCTLLIVRRNGNVFHIDGRIPAIYSPIKILNTISNGRKDISVSRRSEDPNDPAHRIAIRFDGTSYEADYATVIDDSGSIIIK